MVPVNPSTSKTKDNSKSPSSAALNASRYDELVEENRLLKLRLAEMERVKRGRTTKSRANKCARGSRERFRSITPPFRRRNRLTRQDVSSDHSSEDEDVLPLPDKVVKVNPKTGDPFEKEHAFKSTTKKRVATALGQAQCKVAATTGRRKARRCRYDHDPREEADQYEDFRTTLEAKGCRPTKIFPDRSGTFYGTPHAIWLSTSASYRNRDMRLAMKQNYPEKEHFILQCNGTASSVARLIRRVMKNIPSLPIVVVVGSKSGGKFGETFTCVPLVIIPTLRGYRAAVKDSNPIQTSTPKRLVCKILSSLKISKVQHVALLKKDVLHWKNDCFRECYKVVGNILDGSFFWEGDLTGRVKMFKVTGETSKLLK